MKLPLIKRLSPIMFLTLVLGSTSSIGLALDTQPPGLDHAPPCKIDFQLPDQAKVPCNLIVSFRNKRLKKERENVIQKSGAIIRFNYKLVNATAAYIPNLKSLQALKENPDLLLIPDRSVHAIAKPENPGKGNKGGGDSGTDQVVPSGVNRIGAAPGDSFATGEGVGVAIFDTGLDFYHQDIAVSLDCFDAFGGDCQDGNGHGSHVGGIVAALDNSIDVVGVAPNVILYAVKVLNSSGSGSDSTIIAGLDWVGLNADLNDPKIHVINLSLGRPGALDDNPVLREAMRVLNEDLGISIVVSAGNKASLEVTEQVPATYPEVMAIASTTAQNGKSRCKKFSGSIWADTASYFSTDGAYDSATGIGVTLSAPGEKQENINRACFIKSEGILSLKLGGGTTRKSGTSMAAPHVAGVIALLIEINGAALDPEGVRNTLRSTADLTRTAPLDNPTSGYSFDGEREGVVLAP